LKMVPHNNCLRVHGMIQKQWAGFMYIRNVSLLMIMEFATI
jgi:hypothetical protein